MLWLECKSLNNGCVLLFEGAGDGLSCGHSDFNHAVLGCPSAGTQSQLFVGNWRAGVQSLGGECCGQRASHSMLNVSDGLKALVVVSAGSINISWKTPFVVSKKGCTAQNLLLIKQPAVRRPSTDPTAGEGKMAADQRWCDMNFG